MTKKIIFFILLFLLNFFTYTQPVTASNSVKQLLIDIPQNTNQHKKLLFSILDDTEEQENSSIVSSETARSIELFKGLNNENYSLISRIDRTSTHSGSVILHHFIAQTTTDTKILRDRQLFIGKLFFDENIFNQISSAIENIKTSEEDILSFWETNNKPLRYFRDWSLANFFLPKKFVKTLDKTPLALEILDKGSTFFKVESLCMSFAYIMQQVYSIKNITKTKAKKIICINSWEQFLETNGTITDAYNKVFALLIAHATYSAIAQDFKQAQQLQGRLIKLKTLIESVKTLHKTIDGDLRLKEAVDISLMQQTKPLFKITDQTSKNVEKLLNLLRSKTFDGKPSNFSILGNILVANDLVYKIKDDLVILLKFVGIIDSYLSCAKLLKESESKKSEYCFVQYLDRELPTYKSSQFWNPFLDQDTAISNSIELGTHSTSANAIISGPNAGGKSVILRSMIISIIMAQSFGIAPAKYMALTPFSNIEIYSNIIDDIGAGKSFYKSEVLRAKKIIDSVDRLDKKRFSFIAFDEPFHGTNAREGEAIAFGTGQYISELPNVMCLISSHFSAPSQLEEMTNSNFANFHVPLKKNRKNTLSYSFKLTPGVSKEPVGIRMLESEKFNQNVINNAKAFLKN